MNTIRLVTLLGLVAFTSSTVTAAEGDKPKRPSLQELDKDMDGTLSKAELEAVPEKYRARLLESDGDADGALSKDEMAKAKEASDKRRAEREKAGN